MPYELGLVGFGVGGLDGGDVGASEGTFVGADDVGSGEGC